MVTEPCLLGTGDGDVGAICSENPRTVGSPPEFGPSAAACGAPAHVAAAARARRRTRGDAHVDIRVSDQLRYVSGQNQYPVPSRGSVTQPGKGSVA